MDWNAFVDGVVAIFNTPVPIIGCTIGALCIAILSILSKTSIGKKSIKKLTNLYNDSKDKVDNVYNEYQNFKKAKEQEIKELKEQYEIQKTELINEYHNKLAIAIDDYKDLQALLFEISENLHNKNITAIIESYKEKANNEIKGISEVIDKEVENARITYKELFESELKAIQENYTKIIVDMQTEILALKEQVSVNVQKEIESASNDLLDTKEKIIEKVGE